VCACVCACCSGITVLVQWYNSDGTVDVQWCYKSDTFVTFAGNGHGEVGPLRYRPVGTVETDSASIRTANLR
jgi:hypothetical protein